MPPNIRVGVATILLVIVVAYYQLFAFQSAGKLVDRGAPLTAMIADTRAGVERSAHPELYASGSRLGFGLVGNFPPEAKEVFRPVLHYAVFPAAVIADPAAERFIVLFETPADVARFEAGNRVRLLDTLAPLLRVYQVEPNRP